MVQGLQTSVQIKMINMKNKTKQPMSLTKQIKFRKLVFFITSVSFGFFQTVFFISDSCAQSPMPPTSGPIDIQANEQEFQENVVLAKGDVTVTYKDSVVKGPEAKLFRDSAGQPQKAIFSGHPHLVQNESKISADTLIFEIANSKFIAQGNAHSEIESSGDEAKIDMKAAPGQKKEVKNTSVTKSTNVVATSKGASAGKQPFAWPQASDDQNSQQNKTAINTASRGQGEKATTSIKQGPAKPEQAESEKIITDSDNQEYEKDSGKFDATGHVHVLHGTISVFADKLKLVYGTTGKPETALFTGHVSAFQEGNNTQAEMITYYLSTKRLQATGNVKSRMLQQKPLGTGGKVTADKKNISLGTNAGEAKAASTKPSNNDDDNIIVLSDSQDMNQNTGKMSAEGNARVYYQDTLGVGPKVLVLRNASGRAEKVIFTERSQISQPGKRWIADRITMLVATKKILAEGNTKALIIQGAPGLQKAPQTGTALAARPTSNTTATANSATSRNATAIGSSKIEIVR